MNENEKIIKDMHKAYNLCKKVFVPRSTLLNSFGYIEDEEERRFCIALTDFFLQQKQIEVVETEKYEK